MDRAPRDLSGSLARSRFSLPMDASTANSSSALQQLDVLRSSSVHGHCPPSSRPLSGMLSDASVPNPDLVTKAIDVDGRKNYIRRSSQVHGYPIDMDTLGQSNAAYIDDELDDQKRSHDMTTGQSPAKRLRGAQVHGMSKDEDKDLLSKVSVLVSIHTEYASSLAKKWYKWALLILYNLYLVFAIQRTWHKTQSFCDGIKFLTLITLIAYFTALYQYCLRDKVLSPLFVALSSKLRLVIESNKVLSKHLSSIVWLVLTVLVVIYAILITSSNRYRLVSGLGILGFVAIGYGLSEHRSQVKWNQVLWGLAMQFSLALLVLRTNIGKQIFKCMGDKITAFLKYTDEGSSFIFGYLVTGQLEGNLPSQFGIFAFKVLPVILFFSFFVSILYHYGIMQVVVVKLGWLLQVTVGTTACESLNAAANIFLGMTEAPLIIKPYVPLMTKSELFAVMTGGFATIAGSVLAAYINFGVSASHLLSASVMAAPSALGISKLFYPETEESRTQAKDIAVGKGTERNAIEAAANGASQAIKVCSNIAANLIAFLAFIKFMDSMCSWFGANVDMEYISFEWILAKLFVPIALLMGVEWKDCENVAKLIGLKTLVNEFVAYKALGDMKALETLSERSIVIATYALCGFSNFGSIGITMGALGSMVPERKSDLAAIALKAMVAGSTVTFISASMAGLLVDVHPLLMNELTNGTLLNSTLSNDTLLV